MTCDWLRKVRNALVTLHGGEGIRSRVTKTAERS